jgi:hypothetical protein
MCFGTTKRRPGNSTGVAPRGSVVRRKFCLRRHGFSLVETCFPRRLAFLRSQWTGPLFFCYLGKGTVRD